MTPRVGHSFANLIEKDPGYAEGAMTHTVFNSLLRLKTSLRIAIA